MSAPRADTDHRSFLLQFRDSIDWALAQADRASNGPPSAGSNVDELATAFVVNLWGRIGRDVRRLLATAASFDHEFTLGDLAEELNEPLDRVKRRWNGMGRSINVVQREVPGAPPFREGHRVPGELASLSLHPAARDAVRRQDVDAPYVDEG